MMRYGKTLGTLDCKTDVIHLMGSEKSVITESVRDEMLDQMMQGNGIVKTSKKVQTKLSHHFFQKI